MLMNRIGRLFHAKSGSTTDFSKSWWSCCPTIVFLFFSTVCSATAEEASQTNNSLANHPADRTLKSFDLELDELGIFNTGKDTVSRTNPSGMTKEIARQMLQAEQDGIRQEVRQQFCDQAPIDQLCSSLPNDNTDFSELFVYIFLSQAAQNSFDIFSWQSFIALNWPLSRSDQNDGERYDIKNDQISLPRVWSEYKTPRQLFDPDYVDSLCGDAKSDDAAPVLTTSIFLQPSGRPLIDRNLNYLIYDVRVNSAMADYVKHNALDTIQGQHDFLASGNSIEFPVGHYADPVSKAGGAPGSVAIKTAWKIINASDDADRYFTIAGRIPVAAEQSESGQPVCIEAQLGLVGMHIMRRTDSGNGRSWIWSTFEHIDNAPLAANYRRPNDIFSDQLFDGGCKAPENPAQRYALFSEKCPDCPTNHLPIAHWKWADTQPYAGNFANDRGVGSQVVRCWDIFAGTQLINREWQKKLAGTVWANYKSVSAQWKGANRGKTVPEGEVPRFMTNTTMETYDQFSHTGSCLSCHAAARSVAGQPTGFSFLLSLLPRYQPQN